MKSSFIDLVLSLMEIDLMPAAPKIGPDPEAKPLAKDFVPTGAGASYEKAAPPPLEEPAPAGTLWDARNLFLLVPYLGEHKLDTMKKILLDRASTSRLIDKDFVLRIFRSESSFGSLSPFAEELLFKKAFEDVSRIHSRLVLCHPAMCGVP